MKDKILKSFKHVDMSRMKFPAVAVYDHPIDYPYDYVARIFESDVPTNIVMVKRELKDIRKDLEKYANMIALERGPEDDPKLVEVWL